MLFVDNVVRSIRDERALSVSECDTSSLRRCCAPKERGDAGVWHKRVFTYVFTRLD